MRCRHVERPSRFQRPVREGALDRDQPVGPSTATDADADRRVLGREEAAPTETVAASSPTRPQALRAAEPARPAKRVGEDLLSALRGRSSPARAVCQVRRSSRWVLSPRGAHGSTRDPARRASSPCSPFTAATPSMSNPATAGEHHGQPDRGIGG